MEFEDVLYVKHYIIAMHVPCRLLEPNTRRGQWPIIISTIGSISKGSRHALVI